MTDKNYRGILNEYCQRHGFGNVQVNCKQTGGVFKSTVSITCSLGSFSASYQAVKKKVSVREACRLLVLELIAAFEDSELPGETAPAFSDEFFHFSPKSVLNERCQSLKSSYPIYRLRKIRKGQPDRYFHVRCVVFIGDERIVSDGSGTSRSRAESEAADGMLALLGTKLT